MDETSLRCVRTMESPLGVLAICTDDDGLRFVKFGEAPSSNGPSQDAARHADQAKEELAEYFAGNLQTFNVTLAPRGTPFQQRVWAALRTIPWGQTRTYGQLAETLGDSKAVRAVGRCNGLNPWAIIVPCHRVIGADGTLTGYAGGLERKRLLLEHEGSLAPALFG